MLFRLLALTHGNPTRRPVVARATQCERRFENFRTSFEVLGRPSLARAVDSAAQ